MLILINDLRWYWHILQYHTEYDCEQMQNKSSGRVLEVVNFVLIICPMH